MNTFLFGYYPYIAMTVFLLGSLARFERDQFSWRTGSSQLLSSKDDLRRGSNWFHIGILLLFFGHFVGLLTPPAVYHGLGLSTSAKQILAVIAGGIFGGICLAGIYLLIRRRLTDPRVRATSSRMDIFILLLIAFQLVLGLLTLPVSIYHYDGSSMLLLPKSIFCSSCICFSASPCSWYFHSAVWCISGAYRQVISGGLIKSCASVRKPDDQ
jgi:nitrate reductase gamma subunit